MKEKQMTFNYTMETEKKEVLFPPQLCIQALITQLVDKSLDETFYNRLKFDCKASECVPGQRLKLFNTSVILIMKLILIEVSN